MDVYNTISKKCRAEKKIKGSKFIASTEHVSSKDEADLFLEKIRSEFYNATHNCFAYRIGQEGLEFRSSDDGEPSGSAGKPILFSIKKFNYSDIIVVVTRFFGGTKLGIGGLARAYSDAANEVLEICKPKPIYLTSGIKVFCTYDDISVIRKLLDEYAISFKENFSDSVEYLAEIPNSKVGIFCDKVISYTKARAGTLVL